MIPTGFGPPMACARFDPRFGLAAELRTGSLKGEAVALGSLRGALAGQPGRTENSKVTGPAVTVLHSPTPNPFNPSVTVSFSLARAGKVVLGVYDLRGRRVRVLIEGPVEAGEHAVTWWGRDDQDRVVSSGVYFVRLVADGVERTERLRLVK